MSGGQAEPADAELVSGTYFSVLGVTAAIGRTFTPDDDRVPNGHPIVMLSYSFWKRRFGGITGQSLPLSVCPKVARFANDFGKAVGEAVEAMARRFVWQRTTEHLKHMLSREQRIDHTPSPVRMEANDAFG